jgi:hypothetical protein
MENYDYKIEQIQFKSKDHLGEAAKFLHEMSEKGWRLVSLDLKNKLMQETESLDVVLMHDKEEEQFSH